MFATYDSSAYNLHTLMQGYLDDADNPRAVCAAQKLSPKALAALIRKNYREACDQVCSRDRTPITRLCGIALTAVVGAQYMMNPAAHGSWHYTIMLCSGITILAASSQVDRAAKQSSLFVRQFEEPPGKRKAAIPVRILAYFARLFTDTVRMTLLGSTFSNRFLMKAPPLADAPGNHVVFAEAQKAIDLAIGYVPPVAHPVAAVKTRGQSLRCSHEMLRPVARGMAADYITMMKAEQPAARKGSPYALAAWLRAGEMVMETVRARRDAPRVPTSFGYGIVPRKVWLNEVAVCAPAD